MGSHRRSNIYVPIEMDIDAPRGRHRAQVEKNEAGLRAATIVLATGAIVAGAAQLGAGTAAAAPAPEAPTAGMPFEIPQNLLPGGFELPPGIELPENIALPQDLQLPDTSNLQGFGIPDLGAAAQDLIRGLQPIKERAVQPVSGVLTSTFGSRWGAHHGGLDIAAPIGTPILAATDGQVTAAGPASGFGLWVKVLHDDGTETIYGHINDYSVTPGQHVTAGQQIATVGNRGESTGPHLHFEVHDPSGVKVDPAEWLSMRGVSVTWTDAAINA
ncbi:M23 family metallopeptidase [Rhodococcus sp. PAMC28707]|uniref:M23 family metallopeptidase n=1 Tax=unclassified Rhodococcus (in: high G+C Gram-positive bacteria) TaxID=192944 RepID=UPI00109E0702|nr:MULTISPECIES: M23 family metallopeptidase [unclassified Rhodococcus (in: high G+C Gram-positive bacteria)]QCB50818.1 M23 family metallopeptidase [Rhodococcus sp. PAMC28705]QCB57490.1 M23 family metallopeptidase [Rhodococcus sp. PAMC28707]